MPHLPLAQRGQHDPIGTVKVGHQHLQDVLHLQKAESEKQGQGERDKSGLERGNRGKQAREDGFRGIECWKRDKVNTTACAIFPNSHFAALPGAEINAKELMENSPERCTHKEWSCLTSDYAHHTLPWAQRVRDEPCRAPDPHHLHFQTRLPRKGLLEQKDDR